MDITLASSCWWRQWQQAGVGGSDNTDIDDARYGDRRQEINKKTMREKIKMTFYGFPRGGNM